MTILDLGDVGCTPESHKTVVVGPTIIPINIIYYKRRRSDEDEYAKPCERHIIDSMASEDGDTLYTYPWALCADAINLKTGEYAIDAIIVLAESLDHMRLLVRDWAELYVHAAVRMNQIQFDEHTDVERINAFKASTIDTSVDTWFNRVLARIRRAS